MKAFPHDFQINDKRKVSTGMDLRDYFACHAMSALINEPIETGNQSTVMHLVGRENMSRGFSTNLAIASYQIADAMMKQRESK